MFMLKRYGLWHHAGAKPSEHITRWVGRILGAGKQHISSAAIEAYSRMYHSGKQSLRATRLQLCAQRNAKSVDERVCKRVGRSYYLFYLLAVVEKTSEQNFGNQTNNMLKRYSWS